MTMFGFCLPVLVACVIVSTPLIQGRSLRRRHGHGSHSDYSNFEESLPRDLSRRLEDDLEYYRNFYGQTKRREYPEVLDRSSEYENSEERAPPSLHRYKHEYGSRGRESLRRREDSLRKHDNLDSLSMEFVARRKRHNKRENTVNYRRRDQNKKDIKELPWHPELELLSDENAPFELEVRQAQNSSICNYTMESIPDTRGSRVPKNLEHVKCNHIGSSCQDTGTYCCIQTYRNITVSYGDGGNEPIKLYVGCVCAHSKVFKDMQRVVGSKLSIYD